MKYLFSEELFIRWKKAIESGIDSKSFQTRFGLRTVRAREITAKHGYDLPHLEKAPASLQAARNSRKKEP